MAEVAEGCLILILRKGVSEIILEKSQNYFRGLLKSILEKEQNFKREQKDWTGYGVVPFFAIKKWRVLSPIVP